MKKYILYSLVAMASLMGWTSCSEEDEVMQQGKDNVEVQINLAYPVEGYTTKALGDPGIPEDFPAPDYVYCYLVTNNSVTSHTFSAEKNNKLSWKRSSDRDYYVSTTAFNFQQNAAITWARVYVLASKQPLKFVSGTPTTETEIQNIIIEAQQDASNVALNLRDIYSTPYNLMNRDNEYYGTGTIFQPGENGNKTDKIVVAFGTSREPLTLYHVAAKVDFMWEAENHTQATTMKKIEVLNAPTQGYVFKPTKNAKPTSYSSEYVLPVLETTDEGNKWEGRAYDYMLQPVNYTLQYKVTTKKDGNLYTNEKTTVETGMTEGQHEIYAAWYLVRLNMK